MNATCSPIVASGSLADLGYAEEVCAGKPIVDPQLKVFRRRSTTLALTKDAYDSEEIRSDRMVSDSRHGIRRVGGEIVSEVSPASHDDAYEALMGGFWRAGVVMDLVANAVTINANGVAQLPVAGNWATLGFRIGDRITILGTGNIDYDGRSFTILGLRADDPRNATLSNEKGFTFQATTLALGTIRVAGKKLGIGNILRSFVFERAFTDIGRFITYRGVRFNSAAFALPPTGIATVNFGLIGTDADPVALASIDGVPELVKGPAELGVLTFDAAARTVTSSTGDWEDEGFGVGDLVVFTGMAVAPQNNNPRHITAINGAAITVAEAIQSAVEPAFSVRKVALPDYDEVSEEGVLVAVSGTVIVGGRQIGVVTALDMTINNNMAGSEVVGSNIIPTITWGNQQTVQGSLTILFDADAGLEAYNRFDLEQEALVAMRMDSADGQSFLQITLPRCKFNSGTIGDAVATGLPITMDIRGLQPTDPVADNSQVVIQTAYPGVAAPVVFPAPAPVGAITVSVTGQGSSVAGIVVGGGPADRAYTATVIYRVDTDPETETEVDILPGDTPEDVAENLAAAIDATSDLEAQAENGNSVVITPETGTLISAIRVEIA
jgi:hypothetical protein